ncbi:DUF502 domain-containing protein [Vibrio owensii]|uniref:DUF502 domain-containing protein n=1 Tax=Vibrio owensii TaxID=696485 RepID=UPI003CC5ADBB
MSKTYTIEVSSEKIAQWFKSICIGGVFVLAPIACIVVIFKWVFGIVNSMISPITQVFEQGLGFGPIFSDMVALALIFLACFFTGVFVRTQFGNHIYGRFDKVFAKVAPGYEMVKGILKQFLSDDSDNPLKNGKPCLIRPYGANIKTELTGFIVSYSEKLDKYSVFAPSAPNPTSGYVYHLPSDQVIVLDGVTAEEALKTIIGCGMGSSEMIEEVLVEAKIQADAELQHLEKAEETKE